MAFTREKKKKMKKKKKKEEEEEEEEEEERYNWLTPFTNLSDWTNGRILKGVLKE